MHKESGLNNLCGQFDVTVAEFWELDVESKLEAAEKWRLEGNSLFAKGSYREAGDLYHKAVSYLGHSKTIMFSMSCTPSVKT